MLALFLFAIAAPHFCHSSPSRCTRVDISSSSDLLCGSYDLFRSELNNRHVYRREHGDDQTFFLYSIYLEDLKINRWVVGLSLGENSGAAFVDSVALEPFLIGRTPSSSPWSVLSGGTWELDESATATCGEWSSKLVPGHTHQDDQASITVKSARNPHISDKYVKLTDKLNGHPVYSGQNGLFLYHASGRWILGKIKGSNDAVAFVEASETEARWFVGDGSDWHHDVDAECDWPFATAKFKNLPALPRVQPPPQVASMGPWHVEKHDESTVKPPDVESPGRGLEAAPSTIAKKTMLLTSMAFFSVLGFPVSTQGSAMFVGGSILYGLPFLPSIDPDVVRLWCGPFLEVKIGSQFVGALLMLAGLLVFAAAQSRFTCFALALAHGLAAGASVGSISIGGSIWKPLVAYGADNTATLDCDAILPLLFIALAFANFIAGALRWSHGVPPVPGKKTLQHSHQDHPSAIQSGADGESLQSWSGF